MKYGLSEKNPSDDIWTELIKTKIKNAQFVEFNLLFASKKLEGEFEFLNKYIVKRDTPGHKIYDAGERTHRFQLSEEVIQFIFSKKYEEWLNCHLEDLSLISGNTELLAMITHENYIFVMMDEVEREYWNAKGFEFGDLFSLDKTAK